MEFGFYAAETRTYMYKKEDIRRLKAFEMGCEGGWKRSVGGDMKTNEEVLQLVGLQEKRSLMDVIWRRKKNCIGHILRGESLLKEVIEGRMIGKDLGEENDWVC